MTTVRLDIEYDGAGFRGWARQPGLRTVQGVLEAALAQILREEIQLTVAGRTDTGVHALGQVASFATAAALPPDLARNLNGVTPPDVAVRRAEPVADGFDARHDARSRSYLYRVETRPAASPFERGRALWWPHRVDRDALDACAAALVGTHDFTAFTPTQTDHVRFERDVFAASWRDERRRRPPRLPDHRRRLHAQHGPRPGRHDAGGRLGKPHGGELQRPPRGRHAPRGGRHGPAPRPVPGERRLRLSAGAQGGSRIATECGVTGAPEPAPT